MVKTREEYGLKFFGNQSSFPFKMWQAYGAANLSNKEVLNGSWTGLQLEYHQKQWKDINDKLWQEKYGK